MNAQSRRTELYNLLGDTPDRDYPVSGRIISEEDCGSYVLEQIILDLNGIEIVPALLAKPKGLSRPAPAILYNHCHGGLYELGKTELINPPSVYFQSPAYAEVLTGLGYSVICIDHWCFGERRGMLDTDMFKQMLWKGQVLWGMMVYDSIKALDYLQTREDIYSERIGTMGLSMGSTMAWWLSALDERIKLCVDICCMTDFHELIEQQSLYGHGVYYFVPSLLKHFTTSEINALIAPRPHLSLNGNYDCLTPPRGLDRIDNELKAVYKEHGAGDAWEMVRYNTGHFENADMRSRIVEFILKWLPADIS